jgi:hypothetical protein
MEGRDVLPLQHAVLILSVISGWIHATCSPLSRSTHVSDHECLLDFTCIQVRVVEGSETDLSFTFVPEVIDAVPSGPTLEDEFVFRFDSKVS